MTIVEIYKRLSINPDDKEVLGSYNIVWSFGVKPYIKHIHLSKGEFEIGQNKSMFPVPNEIEFDIVVRVFIEEVTRYNIFQKNNDEIPFGSTVFVHEICEAKGLVFNYDYGTKPFIKDYFEKFNELSVGNIHKKDICDDIEIKKIPKDDSYIQLFYFYNVLISSYDYENNKAYMLHDYFNRECQ